MEQPANDRGESASHEESADATGAESDRNETELSSALSPWLSALQDVSPYLDLGWRLAGATAFPPLIGYGLDVWWQTTPWFLLAGCVFGLVGVTLQLQRLHGEERH